MTDRSPLRVRFAPSPTGYLHIGGARTALFNWLYARKHGGTFVLRVEDTDQERSTVESYRAILESMRWLGLDWDEGPEVGGAFGPYTQMERLALYRQKADELVAAGKAYRCYATKEELDVLRKAAEAAKKNFVYPHLWRDKKESDWLPGKPYVVRFKTPLDGETTFHDEVFGTITTPNTAIQDFVIMRSDGVPLYNFGAVVDDVTMQITLVARGRDHIVNTPQQVMLYGALGYPVPRLAHLPMMLAPDGKKLSKREAERYDIPVSVTAYRDRGFSADALINYLVRFGWSHGDQETFTRAELVSLFDFAGASKSDGKFDMKKCLAISHKIIKDAAFTPDARYLAELAPYLAERGLASRGDAHLAAAVATIRERARTFVEAAEAIDFYLRDELVWDEKAKAKFLVPAAAGGLRELAEVVSTVEPFAHAALEARVNAWLAEKGLEIKIVAQPARVALTGRSVSPGLFEVMEVLGRDAVLARLAAGATIAETAQPSLIAVLAYTPSIFARTVATDGPTSPLHALLAHPFFKAVLPVPVLFLLAPIVWWFFRRTWYEIDRDAQRERGALLAEGKLDLRPAAAFVIAAVMLTLQEYYGGRAMFEEVIRPFLQKRTDAGWKFLHLDRYVQLYSYGWWAAARVIGYVVIPFPLWKLLFPKDSLLDLGLRARGFTKHLWIYGVCLAVVVPAMMIVARQPDFGTYYPFYKDASRSWFDLVVWEAIYFAQFFALEMFFRGWWLGTMRRSLGSGAIFAMAVPYCMIHYGKPYLEANGAIIAGIVLGSLSMRTRSIYAGFLVHITVALSMDLLALSHRGALPKILFPP